MRIHSRARSCCRRAHARCSEKTFAQLAQHPECGVPYPTRNRKLQGLRMLPVTGFQNYLVFYRTDAESIRFASFS
ncbi:MAG: hypothetical protein DME32_05545 [Verrucomicrobia bacterium]|nr:MAG: hypothetical protein DME42_05120 [Verrucomicrobiota bacterium]PYL02805.1 MAG: hypothetical protein DME32_05545 [Verrucomicrobiota bacterium]